MKVMSLAEYSINHVLNFSKQTTSLKEMLDWTKYVLKCFDQKLNVSILTATGILQVY